ncbi:hypothetical protein ACFSL4_18855 [Streptomyces caeni]|uniref:Uncharacterized protein n=1 Tax=Streptomyces caeni TaxID=2307231 RepID=A0ABW4IU07_9ACTN
MTPPVLTAADSRTLYALAEEFTAARRRLDAARRSGDGLPALTAASHQLQSLGRLVGGLTDEVLFRIAEPGHRTPQERRAVGVLARAAAPAARALEQFAEAYEQLGLLYEYADHPVNPDLADMRNSAVDVIHDRLDQSRTALQDASHALHLETDRAGAVLPRTAAARSRTTVPDSSAATNSTPTRAAPTPPATGQVSRHGR